MEPTAINVTVPSVSQKEGRAAMSSACELLEGSVGYSGTVDWQHAGSER